MAAMLPWRRSKFVLMEEGEGNAKGKSLDPGLSYASLLSNLVRSCPDLWPACPLESLGSVFRGRRRKVELNKEDPTYTAWYLGNAVTLQAKGEGCTDAAVEKIWAKSEFGGRSTKMKLTLGPQGIRMSPCEKGARRPSHAYLLHRITYCGTDGRHPKVFAWVYRHQVKNKAVVLRCHAVLLSKAEKAHAMALLLCQTSRSAFSEFKRLKRQNDARRVQQQLLGEAIIPLVPLRKLLNCKCPYQPPADRNRSAPRLSSIQEEEEEEKRGKEEEGLWASNTFCSRATTSVNNRTGANVLVCASSNLSAPSAATSTRGIHLSISTQDGALAADTPDSTIPSHNPATTHVFKMVQCRERFEVLALVREMRICTLRAPLRREDSPSLEPPKEPSCLPS